MANNCDYSMKIVGTKENCERFVRKLESYEEPNHFWRFFSVDVYDESDAYDEPIDKNNYEIYICGDCAWSLETCCRASGYSDGIDLFEVNTKELELKLEAWSEEPGIGFQEHYIYDNGECLTDEYLDIGVYWWDRDEYPTYAEFKEDYPDAPEEEKFDDNDEVVVGGFGDEYGKWHI